jgi:hypothetical protein
MNDDRTLERAARSFIEVGPTRAPEHAVDAALLRIESTTQERALRIPWRFPTMPLPARLVALAVVGALVLIGLAMLGGTVGSSPSPVEPTSQAIAPASASPSPSPTPTVVPVRALPESGYVGPGRYVTTMPDAPVDAAFTIDTIWDSGGWWIGNQTPPTSISFWTVANVYRDACDTATLPDPPIGPTVDDLVAALDAQANTDMSAPVDVVVDGHPGVRVELTPSDGLPGSCQNPMWLFTRPNTRNLPEVPDDQGRGIDREGVGELVEPAWILDVDGERVVIFAYNGGLRQAPGDPTAAVIESMTLTKR